MTDRDTETWCIAGGGVLGQVLALRLAQAGKTVTLYEAAPQTGGLAAAWTIDDITWDKFYHVILPADRRTLGLVDEIGLGDTLVWERTRTGFFAEGRMSSLDGAIDYLRLPTLGLIAKLRLAFTLVMASRISNGQPLEHIPVKEWLTKWSGRSAFERLWKPLLRAKLGDNADRASATFIWATARRLYLARKGGAKTEVLGFVDGGYKRVLDALADRGLDNSASPSSPAAPSPVSPPMRASFGSRPPRAPRCFDRVVSTMPSGPTARICEALSPEIRSRLDGVVYQGILCASVVLNRPLGRLLPHLSHRSRPAVHGGGRDVGPDRHRPLRRPHAGLPAALRDAGRSLLGPRRRDRSGRGSSKACKRSIPTSPTATSPPSALRGSAM